MPDSLDRRSADHIKEPPVSTTAPNALIIERLRAGGEDRVHRGAIDSD
ncbi:MAG: hypothetical protein WAN22_30320 [Solirubrobacteraceae bacterium]